jgi:hypothetical protein
MIEFGIDPHVAVATNMTALIFMGLGGALPFARNGVIERRLLAGENTQGHSPTPLPDVPIEFLSALPQEDQSRKSEGISLHEYATGRKSVGD